MVQSYTEELSATASLPIPLTQWHSHVVHYFFSDLVPFVARYMQPQTNGLSERKGWMEKHVISQKRMEMMQKWGKDSHYGCCWGRLRQTEDEKDEAEVLYSGGGEAAHGKSAQSLPSLCSTGVGNIRQPFWCASGFVCCDVWLCVGKNCREEHTKTHVCMCACLCVVCVWERDRERVTCYIRSQKPGRIDFSWNLKLLYTICLQKIQVTLNVSYRLGNNRVLWWKQDIRSFFHMSVLYLHASSWQF